MTRAKTHPLGSAAGKLYDAAKLCWTLALLADRGLGDPSPSQVEYITLLVAEALEQIQAAEGGRP